MTLTKAIEAAKLCLKHYATGSTVYGDLCNQTLAALPDKPKSEDEIIKLVQKNLYVKYSEWDDFAKQQASRAIIRALKTANVLYIEEK